MKAKDIILGQLYVVRVAGQDTPVRIDRRDPLDEYTGTDTRTGRTLYLLSPKRILRPIPLVNCGQSITD